MTFVHNVEKFSGRAAVAVENAAPPPTRRLASENANDPCAPT